MRTLKRILVFILFTMALIGAVGGLKYKKVYAVDYITVLNEDFENYAEGDVFNSTVSAGNWEIYYGNVSTQTKINGTLSVHMKYYKSASSNYPYADYDFGTATTIDKIEFYYRLSNTNVHFNVEYSTDGTNYTVIESINEPTTSKTLYSKVLESPLSITNFRIHVNNTSVAPPSNSYTFRIDDVVLYAEARGEQLTAPTNAAIAGNVLSFDSVTHASGYNVGFFENEAAESPSKVVNINTTSYTFTQQSTEGNNYIKIQAAGDGINYTNSAYTNVGTYTYTDIPVKTISQVSSFENETAAPYSYYDITGTVTTIVEADKSSFMLSDGANELYVFRLRESKGSNTNKTIAELGIEVGFTVRIIACKKLYYSTIELVGYLVSSTPNYGNQFAQLDTSASLKVDYTSNMSSVPENTTASMSLAGVPQINATPGVTYASTLGFDKCKFIVTFLKNGGSNNAYFAKDSVRLYKDSDSNGNGGQMDITCQNGLRISKVVLTILNSYNSDTKVMSASEDANESIEDLVRTYTFNSPSNSITIQNIGAGTTGIGAMTIYYEGTFASSYTVNTETVAAEEKPLVSLMFGSRFTNTLKDNLTASGTVVTYGIAYAKSADLTGASKTLAQALDAGDSFVYDLEVNPVKVDSDGTANESGEYWQLGVSLNHISETSYDTEITASAYVCIDGTYYLMNEKAYSAKSIAQAYLDADYTSYYEHVGILNYLATYGD